MSDNKILSRHPVLVLSHLHSKEFFPHAQGQNHLPDLLAMFGCGGRENAPQDAIGLGLQDTLQVQGQIFLSTKTSRSFSRAAFQQVDPQPAAGPFGL